MASPAAILNLAVIANTKQANLALAGTQARLRATAATSTATGATMKKAFVGIGLAAGAAAVGLFKVGEEFDDAFDKISTRTGATGREMQKLKGVFRGVVADVPASFEDAATAVGDLNTRLGLSGKPLQKMSKQMTELSRITETDVGGNIEAVSKAFVDWEVKTKKQSKTLDGFFRLSQESGLAVADIAKSVQQFGSPLRQLGFDLDTAAAMFANFERAGVNTSTMVPGLKLALANLNAPIGEAKKQLEAFNITIGNAPKGLEEVFKVLGDDKVKAVDRISLAMATFGRRAGADMKEAIEQGRFEVDKFLKVMRGGEGTILEQGRKTRDLSEQWTMFVNNLKLAVEPVARKVFKGLGDLMKEVTATFKKEGLSGVLDLLVEKLSDAIPKVTAVGVKIAEAVVQGFLKAGIWGHLAVGAVVFKMLGGLMAPAVQVGQTMAQRMGAGIKAGLARAGVAAAVVGVFEALTTEGGVIDTIEGEGKTIGKNFAAAVGAGLGPELEEAIDKHSIPALRRLSKQTRDLVKVYEDAGETVPDEVRQMANQSGHAYDDLIDKQAEVKRSIHATKVGFHGDLGDIMRETESTMAKIENSFGSHSKRGKELLSANFDAAIKAIEKAIDTGEIKSGKGLDKINDLIRARLKVYGITGSDAEKIIKAQNPKDATGLQKGGIIHAARGRMVPGRGTGDKVPAMLEPGEVVLNRKAVAAMGGARKANRINRMIPRFAKGGEVGSGMAAMIQRANAWDAAHEPYLYGGGHGGFQSTPGFPVDCSGAVSDVLHAAGLLQGAPMVSGALMNWGKPATGNEPLVVYANPAHTVMSLNGKAFGTSGSNEGGGAGWIEGASGASLAPGAKRTMDVKGAVALANLALKLPRFSGGFPFYGPHAAGLNNVSGGLEKAIGTRASAMLPSGAPGGGDPGQLAGGAYNHAELAALWTKVNNGLADPQMMATLAIRESGGVPTAINHNTNGTIDRGLWQINSVHGYDANKLFQPPYNAWAGGKVFEAQGYDAWSTFQEGGIVGKMSRIASAGQGLQAGGIVQHFAKGGKAKPPSIPQPHIPFDPANVAGSWWQSQHPIRGTGHPTVPKGYTPAPPSIALQFAQLDVAMANAQSTLDVSDDRAVLDQRALIIQDQIRKVSNALSKKGLSAAKRLKLTNQLADLKGQLNSVASDQQALYPSDYSAGGDQTVTDTAAEEAAAADLAAQQALTEAMKALTAELAQQNALVNGALASDYTQALAYIGDLLNGAIGGQVAPRLSTAGSGSVVRY